MEKKINDLAVAIGEYRDPQTGQDKKKWQNIGVEMEADDGGRFILLDPLINLAAIPRGVGKDSIMVSKFAVEGRNNQTPQNQPQGQQLPQQQQPYPVHQNGQWLWSDGRPMNPQEVQFYQNQANQQR
ncbi:MAG: hypothetical protein HUJ13_03910 [Hydrogenovibrio crunogenus]|nr:hypothetical protein [Hydrogenovibrio crunogenus]